MNTILIILMIVAIYLVAGFVFAVFFITRGVARVDEAARGSGWGFRLIILPGTILFWPVLLNKWIVAVKLEKQ